MSSMIGTVTEWVAPYVGGGLTTIGLLFGFLQTGLGARVFDSTFKHYFDRKLTDLKYEQDRKLADVKHVYERNIEELRAELSHLTDRSKLSNERDYQALIASWEGFIAAYYPTLACIARLNSFPDLTQMSGEELDEFFETQGISAPNRRFIKTSGNKNSAFNRVETGRLQIEARSAIWTARDTMRKQSVFIPEDIEREFEKAFDALQNAWAEQYVNFTTPDARTNQASINLIGGGGDIIKNALRDLVRKRVLRNEAAEAS